MGGLPRRNQVIAEQRASGPTLVADAGGALVILDAQPGTPAWPQAIVKAETVASAIAAAGIDAMAVGGRDWELGLRKILALQQADHLPILAANLACDGKRPFPATKQVTIAGHTVGFVGFTWGSVPGCTIEPVKQAAARAVGDLGPVDLLVALAPVPPDEITAIGQAAPRIDLVLDGKSGRRLDTPLRAGSAWWLAQGFRGQNIGLLGLVFSGRSRQWVEVGRAKEIDARIARFEKRRAESQKAGDAAVDPLAAKRAHDQVAWYESHIAQAKAERAKLEPPGGASQFTWKIVPLGTKVSDDPATAKLVAAAKARIAKLEAPSKPIALGARAVASGPWAGSDTCKTCHAAEYAQWSGTAHARAFAGLQGFGRSLDRQCIGCHVTAWDASGGPTAPADAGPYRDVQCEACHGPGRAHVADPKGAKLVADPGTKTCRTCHDGVQDQGRFDPATYLPKIEHGKPASSAGAAPR